MEKCFNSAAHGDGKQVRADKSARWEGFLPPPVGTSDWATFSRDSYCVDKTLILKDLIDSKSRVVLFTRPRRFGIALKPLVEPFPAFIIEVKAADSAKDDLKVLARDARAQIDGKKYDTTFRAEGITDIEKIGLAYFKDKVELCKELSERSEF